MPSANNDLQVLSARLDKLETQARRWKLVSILLAVSSASLILIAAKPADRIDSAVIHARTVEAQDFVVKDEDGQIRARLTLNPQVKIRKDMSSPMSNMNAPLGPVLQFYDSNGDTIWTEPREATLMPAR
jgi:hypothetical protein